MKLFQKLTLETAKTKIQRGAKEAEDATDKMREQLADARRRMLQEVIERAAGND